MNSNIATVWDWWCERNIYYAIYYKNDKIYFSEVPKLLEYKPKNGWLIFLQNLFKRKPK